MTCCGLALSKLRLNQLPWPAKTAPKTAAGKQHSSNDERRTTNDWTPTLHPSLIALQPCHRPNLIMPTKTLRTRPRILRPPWLVCPLPLGNTHHILHYLKGKPILKLHAQICLRSTYLQSAVSMGASHRSKPRNTSSNSMLDSPPLCNTIRPMPKPHQTQTNHLSDTLFHRTPAMEGSCQVGVTKRRLSGGPRLGA